MLDYLQKIGRSLMLPVSVLVVASLFMGTGYAIDANALQGSSNVLATFLVQAGLVVINNLPLLFALGISMGIAEDNNGAAALSGAVSFLMITTLLSPEILSGITGQAIDQVNPAFKAINNVFIGIISGVLAGEMYNRFHNVKLPQWLGFFSGKRAVPIVTAALSALLAVILLFLWPTVYGGLVAFGTGIANLGDIGAGIYGITNKLMIPFGLHHAVNNVFWFDTIGINDIGNFWSSQGEPGVTGRYLAGFFPIMMFGLPGAALAMYKNARPENRASVASLLIAGSVAAFVTGITEPLEFSFMFAAPALYAVHACLTGLSLFICSALHATLGFSFSAGLIDMALSWRMPMANNQWMILVLGLVMFVIYFFLFDFLIRRFDFKTPGREAVSEADQTASNTAKASSQTGDKYQVMAENIYQGLGGKDNLEIVSNCATRLRLQLKDSNAIDEAKIKATGVPGLRKVNEHNLQIVVGTDVQFVADELKEILETDKSRDKN
ncbi:N-acetylglucosamine-specific PTS transporter subunit IIBC [Aerococcus urinae]|uniref:N-acetylglucosamine-specific PTS transporter subunit IIBC n=1 Tax=Aerococcus urinae TaxID=1376 RepID=A0A109REF7_9LACT|nr:N-acetylglucosamine-specific PTS transporter subunit IIBC [Aerococcus urinae]AMB96026.1 PTS glucose transporter subunit IIBC [Aerococcus urinae]MCY3033112.1 N-acetylglucosamine-specific PTS transporter subunit IIBC [Aerococcus urinae]MCY3038256.1 N-acetylglucosamine-specific PTS transporter subunit IIBC [Aerococcus urinae]MCY3045158.1 N-acetylglucosamine-specific PTS transporter subunit IIBC [Aerococcus urinae]MCY3048613.1 N-acetylglucosamine-specific PTS transporter subunit IIBC [Aerococcu